MSSSRFAPIDALRGLAALLVVWLHVTEIFMQLPVPPAGAWLYEAAAAVDTGRIGVVLLLVFYLLCAGLLFYADVLVEQPAMRLGRRRSGR